MNATVQEKPKSLKLVNTHVFNDGNFTVVKLHDTNIVKFNENSIELSTGGFLTSLTKRRMNEVSEAFNLGFFVTAKKRKFVVEFQGETQVFEDSLKLSRK